MAFIIARTLLVLGPRKCHVWIYSQVFCGYEQHSEFIDDVFMTLEILSSIQCSWWGRVVV